MWGRFDTAGWSGCFSSDFTWNQLIFLPGSSQLVLTGFGVVRSSPLTRLFFFFYGRSVLVVTVEPWEFSTPTGWVKTPPTSFSRWFWSTPSTKPSGVTQTPNGSQSLCTSTERCAGWHPRERRAAAWARATSSTWPSEAPAALPGRGATPCSCTATVRACHLSVHSRNKHPFYGDSCFLFHNLY